MEKFELIRYIEELEKENMILNKDDLLEYYHTKIYGVSCNSAKVNKESLFICKGASFKKDYLCDAIKKGACVYISQTKYDDISIPCLLVSDIRKAMAIVTNIYYCNSRDKLNIIGITGTKGKSTTAYYIKYILDEYAKENLKKTSGIISSIKTYDGKNNDYSLLTTPESIELNERFEHMVSSGIENVVMEVSSQALKYDRTYGINFKVCAFLNISEDHISPKEHVDFEDYFSSKLKLFSSSEIACVNLDADFSDRILNEARTNSKKVITFSTKDESADVYAKSITKSGFATNFVVKTEKFEREFVLNMPGLFNVENALAAIAITYALGIDLRFIYSGLKIAKTEGRMELFKSQDNSVIVLVDYAHNKLSFEKVYESTKQEYSDRNIITVFGCPGDKALNRRVDLPSVASKYSSKIYLTSDDPGYESPEKICEEIAKNIHGCEYEIIIDRETAINNAISNAPIGSVVLVLGKGAETIQKCGDKKQEYKSDITIVKQILTNFAKKID